MTKYLLAQTGFCPVLDTYNEILLHPWSDGLPKNALIKLYSLKNNRYDEEKITPFIKEKDYVLPKQLRAYSV